MRDAAIRFGVPTAVVLLCALWLPFLLFQSGHVWDESEHAHVAWLMSQGQRPIDDFFQHHQPILWDLLSLYYRVGFDGAGVLLWGRVIVVMCGACCVWSLLSLGRSGGREGVSLAGLVGVGLLISITVFLQALFVSRPETLAMALIAAALVLWTRNSTPHIIIAGVLAAVACYASPRFLLFGGFFLILGAHFAKKWVLLLTGGAGFICAYTILSGFPLDHVVFNVRFSAYLQSVADAPAGSPPEFWTLFAAATVVPLLPLLPALSPGSRIRGLLLIANLLLVFLACHKLAGMFRYQQAYAPFAAGLPITVTWLVARVRPVQPKGWGMIAAAAFLVLVSVSLLRVSQPPLEFNLLQEIRDKNALAAKVSAGESVLLFTRKHPISIPDASYYGSPLFDARDRLCRAVRGFAEAALPRCDFLRDIQDARPQMVDAWIERAIDTPKVPAFRRWLAENYIPAPLPDVRTPLVRDGILVRRETPPLTE